MPPTGAIVLVLAPRDEGFDGLRMTISPSECAGKIASATSSVSVSRAEVRCHLLSLSRSRVAPEEEDDKDEVVGRRWRWVWEELGVDVWWWRREAEDRVEVEVGGLVEGGLSL